MENEAAQLLTGCMVPFGKQVTKSKAEILLVSKYSMINIVLS